MMLLFLQTCSALYNMGRMIGAMDMRKWDLDEIERLTVYIIQSRQKMETELNRLKRYQEDFNDPKIRN